MEKNIENDMKTGVMQCLILVGSIIQFQLKLC